MCSGWPGSNFLAGDYPGESEAVQLFLERATAIAGPDLGATDLEAVARLCRRVDGLPLAIELAAALVRAIGVAAIAAASTRTSTCYATRAATLPNASKRCRPPWSGATAFLLRTSKPSYGYCLGSTGPFPSPQSSLSGPRLESSATTP